MTKIKNDKYLYHSGNVGRDDGLTSVWISFQERNGNGAKTHYFSAPFDTTTASPLHVARTLRVIANRIEETFEK